MKPLKVKIEEVLYKKAIDKLRKGKRS